VHIGPVDNIGLTASVLANDRDTSPQIVNSEIFNYRKLN